MYIYIVLYSCVHLGPTNKAVQSRAFFGCGLPVRQDFVKIPRNMWKPFPFVGGNAAGKHIYKRAGPGKWQPKIAKVPDFSVDNIIIQYIYINRYHLSRFFFSEVFFRCQDPNFFQPPDSTRTEWEACAVQSWCQESCHRLSEQFQGRLWATGRLRQKSPGPTRMQIQKAWWINW